MVDQFEAHKALRRPDKYLQKRTRKTVTEYFRSKRQRTSASRAKASTSRGTVNKPVGENKMAARRTKKNTGAKRRPKRRMTKKQRVQKKRKQVAAKKRRVIAKKGVDPSKVPRVKKFHFKTSCDFAFTNVHTVSGLPQDESTTAGVQYARITMNDLWITAGGTSVDGFEHISPDYDRFYTIMAKFKFVFDEVNAQAYKVYMVMTKNGTTTNAIELINKLGLVKGAGEDWDMTDVVSRASSRHKLHRTLEERVDRKLVSWVNLQEGTGYDSRRSITMTYTPKRVDGDRGKVMDEKNVKWATSPQASPENKDSLWILFVPTQENLLIPQYYGDTTAGATSGKAASIYGKLYMEHIAIGVKDSNSRGYRFSGGSLAQYEGIDFLP